MCWVTGKRTDPIAAAEEVGYDVGWMGLDNLNPYRYQSPEWVAYNWGYEQAMMDEEELNYAFFTEGSDDYWPYDQYH